MRINRVGPTIDLIECTDECCGRKVGVAASLPYFALWQNPQELRSSGGCRRTGRNDLRDIRRGEGMSMTSVLLALTSRDVARRGAQQSRVHGPAA
jgi:hypothetical protein